MLMLLWLHYTCSHQPIWASTKSRIRAQPNLYKYGLIWLCSLSMIVYRRISYGRYIISLNGFSYLEIIWPSNNEALRYAKVWGRNVVRSLTLAYAKRLFPDSNSWSTSHQGTTLPLHQDSPSLNKSLILKKIWVRHKFESLLISLLRLRNLNIFVSII